MNNNDLFLSQGEMAAVIEAGLNGIHKVDKCQLKTLQLVVNNLALQLLSLHEALNDDEQNEAIFKIQLQTLLPLKPLNSHQLISISRYFNI